MRRAGSITRTTVELVRCYKLCISEIKEVGWISIPGLNDGGKGATANQSSAMDLIWKICEIFVSVIYKPHTTIEVN